MPRVNLTHKIVEATPLPLGRKSVDYFDRRMPGLVLRVSAGGTKSWNAVYRHHGRARRLTSDAIPFLPSMMLEHVRARHFVRCRGGMIPASTRGVSVSFRPSNR